MRATSGTHETGCDVCNERAAAEADEAVHPTAADQ